MKFNTPVSPHLVGHGDVSHVMKDVLIALIPGTVAYSYLFSPGVLLNVLIAVFFALASEAFVLMLRKRPVLNTLNDLSAIVTAWLFALTLPPMLPWWILAIGIIFAIVVAKQLYGGIGYNPFNPAMVGYVLLLISYPREMTSWLAPQSIAEHPHTLTDISQGVFSGASIDAFTMATPLGEIRNHLSQNGQLNGVFDSPLFGMFAGTGWEYIGLAWLLGGAWLLYRRIITWHIPATMLASLTLISSVFYLIDSSVYLSPLIHLFSGAAILGAFFIATGLGKRLGA